MGASFSIERIRVIAGRLLVTLRDPPDPAPDRLSVTAGQATNDAPVLLACDAPGEPLLLVLDLDAVSDLPLLDAPLRLTLPDGATATAAVTPVAIDAAGIAPDDAALIRRALAAGAWEPPVAAALRWRLATPESQAGPDAGLHYGVPLGGGAMVAGWVANLGDRALVLLSDGLESACAGRRVAAFRWPDLSERLAREGRTVTTDRHGFAAVLPLLRSGDRGFLLFEGDGDDVRFLTRISWEGQGHGSADRALEDTLAYLGSPAELRPLLARRPAGPPATKVIDVVPAAAPPALSVVVPLFGRSLLLRALLAGAGALPPEAELVLVCDDPDLAAFARAHLRERAPLIDRPVRLLVNAANYGFATACNLGARAAAAPILLFLNSDVSVEDAGALAPAMAAIRDGRFGTIGFRLLFEDGTVQHDGMDFRRHRGVEEAWHDLWLAEHPGKGLPPLPAEPGVHPVAAVTGAALMIAADWFAELGGFDPGYVRGDFEDADLCLRSTAAGRPSGLIRTGRIVHLERQSIGPDAPRSRALTWLNARRFNDRWAAHLEASCGS